LSVYTHVSRRDFLQIKRLLATWIRLRLASIFVLLNVIDALCTTHLLNHGGAEAIWWSAHFNSNVMLKGLLAFLVAFLLIRLNRTRLLKWLNIGMVFVLLSNCLCFLAYTGSWLYWQTKIATFPLQ
jgi:hypothetical protein